MLLPYVYYRDSKKANLARLALRSKIHTSQLKYFVHLENFKLEFKDDDEEGGIDLYHRG